MAEQPEASEIFPCLRPARHARCSCNEKEYTMTRSIFDSTSGEAERSGAMFTPPDANQVSHLPEEFTSPPSTPLTGTVDFEAKNPGIVVTPENDGKLISVTTLLPQRRRRGSDALHDVSANPATPSPACVAGKGGDNNAPMQRYATKF
jgi:hypothetical protein